MPLVAHFLNVGHGDCTILEHPSGRITVIDINNGSEIDAKSAAEISASLSTKGIGALGLARPSLSTIRRQGYSIGLTNPIQYLSRISSHEKPFRYIQTHPDLDHMRGISALVSSGLTPVNFWDTDHDKEPELQEQDIEDWNTYLTLRWGHFPDVTVLKLLRGASADFYREDQIEVLSPSPSLVQYATERQEWNEVSYVLRVSHGGRSMILGGDAGEIAWQDIYATYQEQLSCQVLKASHHGRRSGYHRDSVRAMSPAIAVVSVGQKPSTDATNLYRQYCENVWSSRWKGNITITFPDSIDEPMLYDWEYER